MLDPDPLHSISDHIAIEATGSEPATISYKPMPSSAVLETPSILTISQDRTSRAQSA